MTSREIFRESCAFGAPECAFRWEVVAAWATTLDRWHEEGLPEGVGDTLESFYRYFDMDWHIGCLNFDVVHSVVPVLLESEGYVPMLDHSSPPNISLEAMKYTIDRIRYWSRKIYGGERSPDTKRSWKC